MPSSTAACPVCGRDTDLPLCSRICRAEASARIRANYRLLRQLPRDRTSARERRELTAESGQLFSAVVRFDRA